MAAPGFCSACGAALTEGARFCAACGVADPRIVAALGGPYEIALNARAGASSPR